MPRHNVSSALMKPLVVLALPGMYLVYKINEFKRHQQEVNRRNVTERELANLNNKIDKLLTKLDEHEPELANTQDEECVICVGAKATMQTFPCGHRVVCRKCFVKTIQMAVSQRMLPLRCVICRTKIIRLKQTTSGFATPATHTPHLANTRACLLRQPGLIDADGFNRSPFLTPKDYEELPAPCVKQYPVRQECRFHRHWKNKVAAAPLPQDVNEMLSVSVSEKELRAVSPVQGKTKPVMRSKGQLPHLPSPPRKKDLRRTPLSPVAPLSPTIIIENNRYLDEFKDKKAIRLENIAKDRRKLEEAESDLEMIPLIRLDKPPSSTKRRSSKGSSTPTTPEICVTPPEGSPEEETHLIITTQPIKKLEYRIERHALPIIPPPRLTLVDPNKGDRQVSILDGIIDEEDELLLSLEDDGVLEKQLSPEQTSPEVRIAPPPDFRRRSHRVSPEIRIQKHYHPTTRFEKFKHYHVRQPLPLFPIPEREEMSETIELKEAQAFYKVDDKMAGSQSIPLISADNMVTVGGSFLNSAMRTKMTLLSGFKQLRSRSPLKAFGVRSRKTVAPLLDVAAAPHSM